MSLLLWLYHYNLDSSFSPIIPALMPSLLFYAFSNLKSQDGGQLGVAEDHERADHQLVRYRAQGKIPVQPGDVHPVGLFAHIETPRFCCRNPHRFYHLPSALSNYLRGVLRNELKACYNLTF